MDSSKSDMIVLPAMNGKQAIAAWAQYNELKQAIKTKDDVQVIAGREYLKKSYWAKVARFFNLSVEVVEEKQEQLHLNGRDVLVYHFKSRATAPIGAFAEGVGSCDTTEKGMEKSIHNTRSIAQTRSFNRAVSNLVGGGEVSADEIVEETGHPQPAAKPSAGSTKPAWVIGECPQCGSELKKDMKNPDEYYCAGYKDKGCKVRGFVKDLDKAKTKAQEIAEKFAGKAE